MPSRAEPRRALEWLLRTALVALLAAALWRSTQRAPARPEQRRATARTLSRTVHDATRDARITAIDLSVDSLPTEAHRGWLRALRGAGVAVHWHGTPPPLALAAERAREPNAPVRVLLAADAGAEVTLTDSAGTLDTLRPRGGGAALEAADVVGMVRARRGSFAASTSIAPAAAPRAVLVLGRASWESKFVLAALGDAGWTLRAWLPAAPGVAVVDRALLPIDTARYDVVVALDSTAASLAPDIARFVAAGGGLVVGGDATTLEALRTLVPARAGARRPGRILLDADTVTRADLPLRPLTAFRADAVRLERQGADVTVAVRRAGRGRVLAIGYDESWRWRMLGGSSGPAAHRAWWSRSVGLVAPEHEQTALRTADAAPTAALVEALGPASRSSASSGDGAAARLPLAILLGIAVALLVETASRRLRGAR
jgi:hypothetical protein